MTRAYFPVSGNWNPSGSPRGHRVLGVGCRCRSAPRGAVAEAPARSRRSAKDGVRITGQAGDRTLGRTPIRLGGANDRKNSTTPGWIRTSDPGIRNLRRDDFATPGEITKSTVSVCPSTTSGSTSDFASTTSFTAQRAKKAADLRSPQIQSWPSKTNDSSRASLQPDGLKGSA